MGLQKLSIRNILLLTIATLTLLIILLVAQEAYVQGQRLSQIHTLKAVTVLGDELFDMEETLSAERDITYSILSTPHEQVSNTLLEKLQDSQTQTDLALRTVLDSLKKYNFPEINSMVQQIEMQYSGLQELRHAAEPAIRNPQKRDLAQHWFTQSTTMIIQTQGLWMALIKHFTAIDPFVIRHMRFKHILGVIMEYTGRERSLIGRLLAENADPTPQEQAQLLQWHGAVEVSWYLNDTLADQGGLYPYIMPYFKDAKSHYFTVYDMARDIFYIPGKKHGASYPVSAAFWLDMASQTTDSLDALKDASLKETQRYVDALELKAQRKIWLNSLFLMLALGVCLYSFRVITYRVINPIHAMIEVLMQAIQGKAVSVAPLTFERHDEIGQLAQVLHAFQQNTEKIHQAEKSHSLLAAIVESSENAIVSKSLDGIIMSWNPGAERVLGYSPSEAIGQHINLIIPPERVEEEQYIITQISHGKGVNQFETLRRHKDGNYIDVSIIASPIYDSSGNIIGTSKVIRNITAEKKARHELVRYTQALERSNKELDDFAYIASHDLKEPLRGIHNHSRFLLEDNREALDADSVSRLERLSYLSQRMERLVNDLLYFSRLGRQELAIGPTDINDVIHDIESTLDVFLEERHGRITIPETLPTIICDKPRITEAFRNLITNAIKYNDNPEKIVEIGFLRTYTPPNDTTTPALADVFYVKDNGKGIAPGFYQEIFRIFKRLQSVKDQREEGTGVGLTFVKKIIERHGGKIWLESEVGRGTTFYFTLKYGDDDIKPSA